MVIRIDGECWFHVPNVTFKDRTGMIFAPIENYDCKLSIGAKNHFRAIRTDHVCDAASTKCTDLRSKNQELCSLVTMYF